MAENVDKHTVEKFLNDSGTTEEANQVVEWLATDEGQAYLSHRLDEDAGLLKNEKVKPLLPDLNSKKMWSNIEEELDSSKKSKRPLYYHRHVSSYRYVAAAVFLMCVLSIFFYGKYLSTEQTTQKQQPIHFVTNAQQQKEIMLSDGTIIKLNSNSELSISATYGQPKREVTLEGEAYFEINHNPAKPFVIHTKGMVIKDLGTAFNVRALPGKNNIQIAVKHGKVSILPEEETATRGDAVTKAINLSAGQYAYVNLKTNSANINEFEVRNYFSWMNDQLRFNSASLAKASTQLSHIYNVTFSYSADSLKAMRFSAQFERESLKRTLAVIALTLSIDYEIKNHHVIWK